MSIDFRKPAFMDDVLDIVTTPEEVKGASVTLNQKVMRGEDLLWKPTSRWLLFPEGAQSPSRSRCALP